MLQLQLLSLLFALAMGYWTWTVYRLRTIRLGELFLWLAVWGAFSLAVLLPQSVAVFVQRLHVNRVMDLFMILGFMLVWVVLFLNHLELRRLQKRLQDLVRELALRADDGR
jgi:hypothetical protein